MAYRALKSFSGKITMVKGEVREIADAEVAKDLVKCGYVADLTPTKTEKAEKAEKATRSRKAKKEEAEDE